MLYFRRFSCWAMMTVALSAKSCSKDVPQTRPSDVSDHQPTFTVKWPGQPRIDASDTATDENGGRLKAINASFIETIGESHVLYFASETESNPASAAIFSPADQMAMCVKLLRSQDPEIQVVETAFGPNKYPAIAMRYKLCNSHCRHFVVQAGLRVFGLSVSVKDESQLDRPSVREFFDSLQIADAVQPSVPQP